MNHTINKYGFLERCFNPLDIINLLAFDCLALPFFLFEKRHSLGYGGVSSDENTDASDVSQFSYKMSRR